jgi:hypothetical protein
MKIVKGRVWMDRLYMLREQGTIDFKLGHAIDPLERIPKFKQKIDLSRSVYVECHVVRAKVIEDLLKDKYKEFNFTHELVGDGCTECYYGECWDQLCRDLEDHREFFGCSELRPGSELHKWSRRLVTAVWNVLAGSQIPQPRYRTPRSQISTPKSRAARSLPPPRISAPQPRKSERRLDRVRDKGLFKSPRGFTHDPASLRQISEAYREQFE